MSQVIDLGTDPERTSFKLNGQTFECFPLDEIEAVNQAALTADPPATEGEAFTRICQDRLKSKFGVEASLTKAGAWYDALHVANEDQKDFFAESPASSASTDSHRGGSAGEHSLQSGNGQPALVDF